LGITESGALFRDSGGTRRETLQVSQIFEIFFKYPNSFLPSDIIYGS
jgi:hypothetical protein